MRELLVIVQRDLKQRALRRLAAEAENCETKPPARPGEGAHEPDTDFIDVAFG
jgi:hypothetical protein